MYKQAHLQNRYRALFFDADDTLFDYQRAETAAFTRTVRDSGYAGDVEPLRSLYRRHNAALWKALERGEVTQDALKIERFARLLADADELTGDAADMSSRYLHNLSEQTVLIDGAEETVALLAPLYTLVLVTNGLTSVQRPRFAATPMVRLFQTVLISEELGVAKPDPAIFASALQAHKLLPDEVLLIGDGAGSDMPAARAAGMDFVWMNPQRLPVPEGFRPVAEISSPREIPGLLGHAAAEPSRL